MFVMLWQMKLKMQNALCNMQKTIYSYYWGKVSDDKILIIEQLMLRCNHILIGGGMAYTFFKAMGGNIDHQFYETDKLDLAKQLLNGKTIRGSVSFTI